MRFIFYCSRGRNRCRLFSSAFCIYKIFNIIRFVILKDYYHLPIQVLAHHSNTKNPGLQKNNRYLSGYFTIWLSCTKKMSLLLCMLYDTMFYNNATISLTDYNINCQSCYLRKRVPYISIAKLCRKNKPHNTAVCFRNGSYVRNGCQFTYSYAIE